MLTQPQVSLMQDEFGLTYLEGILATTIIPTAIMPLAIPMWSRLMDRSHITRFRSIHGWSFVAASILLWLAALVHSLPLFYAASVALGIGFAGGVLAWNLGHHDFAPPHRDAEYMAVHVTLNGLRGLMAPFIAAPLYALMPPDSRHWVFALCTVVNVAGMVGFIALSRRIDELHRPAPARAA
jgi:MFS family permease